MPLLRNKFHMIDICACLFLSSMRKAHMTRRKSGFNKAGLGGGNMTDVAARMTLVHLLSLADYSPFSPAQ